MRQAAEEATRKAVEAAGAPGPTSVAVRAVSGIAPQELISASNDADLVVVGSRGGGGFARLMLGSTSNQSVSHWLPRSSPSRSAGNTGRPVAPRSCAAPVPRRCHVQLRGRAVRATGAQPRMAVTS